MPGFENDALNSSFAYNSDNDDGGDLWRARKINTPGNIALIIAYFFVIVVGLIGNSMVIHAVRINRSMHTSTNYLIANIAVADLTTMVICVPFTILKFFKHPSGKFGRFLCTLITKNNISTITLSVSIFTLCILAVERYNALVKPLQHHLRMTKRATMTAILITWGLALLSALPLLIFTNFNEKTNYCYFSFTTHLYWIGVGAVTFIVLVVICYCYFKVLREIYRKRLLVVGNCAPQWQNNETTRSKRKLTNLLLILTLAFVLFYVPRMIYLFFSPYMKNGVGLSAFKRISFFLIICNSSANPIICGFQSDNYRKAFVAMFRRRNENVEPSRDVMSRRDWRNTSRQRESHF